MIAPADPSPTSVLALDHHGEAIEGEGPRLSCPNSGAAVEVRRGSVYARGLDGRWEAVLVAGELRWHCFDVYAERLRMSDHEPDAGVIALIHHDGADLKGMLAVSSSAPRRDDHRAAALRQMASFFERAPAASEGRLALRDRLRDALVTPARRRVSRLVALYEETNRVTTQYRATLAELAAATPAHPDGDGAPWWLLPGQDPHLAPDVVRVDMVFDGAGRRDCYRAVPSSGSEGRGASMASAVEACALRNGARWFLGPFGTLYEAGEGT